MDLKTRGRAATAAVRESIDTVLGAWDPPGSHDRRRGHAIRARRHLLLPTLHAVNDRVGWVSPEAIDDIAERLDIAPAEIHGIVSFYGLFSTSPRPNRQIHVCVDLACRIALDVDALPGGCHPSPCLGRCTQAPAALVIEPGAPARRMSIGNLDQEALSSLGSGEPVPDEPTGSSFTDVPQAGGDDLVLLARVGRSDPVDLDQYRSDGGLRALERAKELGPDLVIAAVEQSGLLGRGGAAFPTGRKWRAVREQPGSPHHLVCNADESEPGTFKDRVLLEHDPFAVLEAMCIAGLATGCEHGWIYLRGEYPEAEAVLRGAVDKFRAAGLLGDGAGFDVTVVRGAGAYVCGEETALFNSIEGYRGEPRNKPPFPFQSGLFGAPTVVNNVETLVNVPPILLGARADRRLFSVSGAVERPGVYEVELGGTLGDLIELAGGLQRGSEVRAVLLGGAAGRFLGPDAVDLVLDHDRVREAGLSLGSGVVMVHDQHVDLADQGRRIAAFFRSESCGQCVPCRVGTVRQQELVDRLATGTVSAAERIEQYAVLADLDQAMGDASICGLGHTAGHAVESLVRLGAFERARGDDR